MLLINLWQPKNKSVGHAHTTPAEKYGNAALFLQLGLPSGRSKKWTFQRRRSETRRNVNSRSFSKMLFMRFPCRSLPQTQNPKWSVRNVASSTICNLLTICSVHRVSTMDGPKLSATTPLNATCTNCARNPWKENAFSSLLQRIGWRSWLIKWRGVNHLVQTCTTTLFVRLANFTGRKILQPGTTPPAPSNAETLQSCRTFSLTHVTIFQKTKKCRYIRKA